MRGGNNSTNARLVIAGKGLYNTANTPMTREASSNVLCSSNANAGTAQAPTQTAVATATRFRPTLSMTRPATMQQTSATHTATNCTTSDSLLLSFAAVVR